MTYVLKCHKCSSPFDACAAAWCACGSGTASLECAKCSACFCNAPAPYRRKAWSDAPRELRESVRRFRCPARCANPPTGGPRSRKPVVLIVDDDESIRSLVACVIENLGYRTIVCEDALQALSLAAAEYVDVVLTDALMPKLDGRELCRLIKQWHGTKKKVIVMTSLYRKRLFRNEAMNQFGADEYLTKPLDFDRLAQILAAFAPLAEIAEAEKVAALK
jgi:CheY-like chemotaxis protein